MSIPIDRLIKRVEVIARECAPEPVDSEGNVVKQDEFTKKKKDISQHIKTVRAKLKERESLLEKNADIKRTAELSQQIRADIRLIKEKIEAMATLQKKEAKRARKMAPDVQEAVARREEIVQLCNKHVEELEAWEKRRLVQERDSLFSGASLSTSILVGAGSSKANSSAAGVFGHGGGGGGDMGGHADPEETELPDVGDYSDQMEQIRERNRDIDADLDAIAEGVGKLKAIAIDIGTELDVQNKMIEELNDKVDVVGGHLMSLNSKLKHQLDGVMKGDKFLVNFVLCLILLAIIGFIASQFA